MMRSSWQTEQPIITDEDMVNEDEAKEEMKNILLTGSPNPDEEGQG